MEQSLKIKPTVYVGLGTTGMEILNHLRRLNHLEYGKAGLPIFRYVSIETDAGKTGIDPQIDDNHIVFDYEDGVPKSLGFGHPPRPYEVNEVIHTTLSYPEPIRARVNSPDSPIFNEHLASWLDVRILDSPAVNGGSGAGNLRMAGRLALWENWNKGSYVRSRLLAAYNTVQHQVHRKDAESTLRDHFEQPIEVDGDTHNIFIVGTLCGGTCSGMLLDIAYYFRHIGNEYTKIYGIFTMYNEGLALGGDSKILLANCYASLVELDFYERPGTEYRLTLPDGAEIHERRAPFNVATFLSPTNMKGLPLVDLAGEFVTGQLDQMVATDLFVRSLGVDSLIEADLVNAPARDPRFKKVRDVADADETAFVQSMFGSGVDIEGVWLPKVELVSFAAKLFIEMLRGKWENGAPLPGSPEANKFVPAGIVEEIKSNLQIEAFDAKLQADINAINRDNYPNEARACLEALVVHQGAKYYDESEENRAAYSQRYRERLNKTVAGFEGASQLCRKRKFLEEVEALIQAALGKLADDFSEDLVESEVDIGTIVNGIVAADTTERNTNPVGRVIRELLRIKDAEEPKITAIQSRIYDERTPLRKKFTDWCVGTPRIREVLRDILSDTEALRREVAREIDDIGKRFVALTLSYPADGSSSSGAVWDAAFYWVHEKTDLGSPRSIEKLLELMCKAEPDAFFWHLQQELQKSFRKFVTDSDLIASLRFDKEAGKRSSPYQEFTPFYDSYNKLNFDEKGGSTRLFRYLLAEEGVAKSIGDLNSTQAQPQGILVPNLRVLYQMEAGYTPDDVRVAGQLKKAYDAAQKQLKKGAGDPVHIYKDPDMFDQKAIQHAQETVERLELVKREWRVLRELLPRIREEDENRFQYVSPNGNFNGTGSLNGDRTLDVGELTIKVVGKAGIRITFSDDEGGWEKLAADAEASNNFIREIQSEFGSMLDGFPPDLIELIDDLNGLVGQEESEKFYADYLDLLREHSENLQG